MSKKNKALGRDLARLRSMMIQSITFLWLMASSFLIFMYMVHQFFPDAFMLFVVVFMTALTVISGYTIQKVERLIKYMWDKG